MVSRKAVMRKIKEDEQMKFLNFLVYVIYLKFDLNYSNFELLGK